MKSKEREHWRRQHHEAIMNVRRATAISDILGEPTQSIRVRNLEAARLSRMKYAGVYRWQAWEYRPYA